MGQPQSSKKVPFMHPLRPIGLPSIQTKPASKKKKSLCPNGSIVSDTTESISDDAIKKRNAVILNSLRNSESVIETAKTWKVGALLTIFDADSRVKMEQVLLKNIAEIHKDTKTGLLLRFL